MSQAPLSTDLVTIGIDLDPESGYSVERPMPSRTKGNWHRIVKVHEADVTRFAECARAYRQFQNELHQLFIGAGHE